MSIFRILLLVIPAFMVFACATTDGNSGAPESTAAVSDVKKVEFQSALDTARNNYANAEKAGFAWRDTEDMLNAAEQAFQAGDMDKAMKLVTQANRQASDAYKQYETEMNAGPRYD